MKKTTSVILGGLALLAMSGVSWGDDYLFRGGSQVILPAEKMDPPHDKIMSFILYECNKKGETVTVKLMGAPHFPSENSQEDIILGFDDGSLGTIKTSYKGSDKSFLLEKSPLLTSDFDIDDNVRIFLNGYGRDPIVFKSPLDRFLFAREDGRKACFPNGRGKVES